MNRKQRRKFNKGFSKLPPEQQEEFASTMVWKKIEPVLGQEIAKSMISGMNALWSQLYTDYVEKYDEAYIPEEQDRIIEELLSLIRTQYLRIESEKAKDIVEKGVKKNEI